MLIPSEAKYPTIYEEIDAIFSDLEIEYVACSMCGCDHPPELRRLPRPRRARGGLK